MSSDHENYRPCNLLLCKPVREAHLWAMYEHLSNCQKLSDLEYGVIFNSAESIQQCCPFAYAGEKI